MPFPFTISDPLVIACAVGLLAGVDYALRRLTARPTQRVRPVQEVAARVPQRPAERKRRSVAA